MGEEVVVIMMLVDDGNAEAVAENRDGVWEGKFDFISCLNAVEVDLDDEDGVADREEADDAVGDKQLVGIDSNVVDAKDASNVEILNDWDEEVTVISDFIRHVLLTNRVDELGLVEDEDEDRMRKSDDISCNDEVGRNVDTEDCVGIDKSMCVDGDTDDAAHVDDVDEENDEEVFSTMASD